MTAAVARALLACAALCLPLAACGDDESPKPAKTSGSGTTPGVLTTPATTPTAGRGDASGLGAARYAALDRAFSAQIPLDAFRERTSGTAIDPAAYRAAARPAIEACAALDRGAPLLAAMRRLCATSETLNEQLLGLNAACQSKPACVAALATARTSVAAVQRDTRATDRAIAAAKLTPACESALSSRKGIYKVLAQIGDGLRLLGRGFLSGKAKDMQAGQNRLAHVDKLPGNKERYERFTKACA